MKTASALFVLGLIVCVAGCFSAQAQVSMEVEGDTDVDEDLTVTGTITAGSGANLLTNAAGLINGAKVQTQTIGSAQLATSAVTPSKLDASQTYSISKLGVNTSTVPHASIGYAKLAIDGANQSLDGTSVQLTTDADEWPVFSIHAYTHDSISLRFDSYYGTNDGSGMQRSSDSGSNASIIKAVDHLYIKIKDGIAPGTAFNWDTAFDLNCTDGTIVMPYVYNTIIGAGRDLYIDNYGKLGYLSSSIEYKENVRVANTGDTGFIYRLRPVMYDYKDRSMGVNRCGLIAEEVAMVCPDVVSYKRNVEYLPPSDADDPNASPEMVVTDTDIPETVNYSNLIVPMLAEMQRLKAEVEDLKARLGAVESGGGAIK